MPATSPGEQMESHKISRFLIVDENKESAMVFKILLMNQQFQNITIIDGNTDPTQTIEHKRIQFILVAWEGSVMNGSAVVQRILAKRHLRYLPILIYSNNMSGEEENLVKELNLPYIIKYPLEDESEVINLLMQMITEEENLNPIEHRIRQVEGHISDGQYELAIHEIEPALEHVAFQLKAHTLLGEIYLTQESFQQAEISFNSALSIEANHTPALQSMAKVYQKTNRPHDAIDLLKKMSTQSPYNIQTLLSLGVNYVSVEDYDNAKIAFNRVKELDPSNPSANDELGKIAFQQGDYEKARELLAGTQNSEEIIRHFNNLAIGLVSRGQHKIGIETYEIAISLMKDAKHLHILQYNLGLAYRKAREFKKAFNTLLICCEDNLDFPKPYAALVRVIKEMEANQISYDRVRAKELKKAKATNRTGKLF